VFNKKTRTYHPNETFGMVTSLNSRNYNHPKFKEGILLKCTPDLVIHKDVKIQWNLRGRVKKGKKRAFSLWFNTDFIEGDNRLCFVKNDIDKVNKLEKLSDFTVCIELEPLDNYKVATRGENSLDLNNFKNHDQSASSGKKLKDAVEGGERLRYHGLIKAFSNEDIEGEGKLENTNQLWRDSKERCKSSSVTIEGERKENLGALRMTDYNDCMEDHTMTFSTIRGGSITS